MKPDLICLADVNARRVDWLWEPYIPARMLSMISGDPAAGKSYIALALAAGLSRGRLLDGRVTDPASTIYLTCENPIAESIRPRFDSLGGDPARLFVLKGIRFEENGEERQGAVTLADISVLDAAISEKDARLSSLTPFRATWALALTCIAATKPARYWMAWQSSQIRVTVRSSSSAISISRPEESRFIAAWAAST